MQGAQGEEDFAALLDQATSAGHLPDPWQVVRPDLRDANRANSDLYIRALRSRLFSLGYTDDKELKLGDLTPVLSAAILRFQSEARLKPDGWAGPDTKQRLQQLVSFEEEQDPEGWDIDEDPGDLPAVQRAAYLRLYTLGFMDWEDDAQALARQPSCDPVSNPVAREALRAFLALAQKLGLVAAAPAPVLSVPVLRLLFGHDAMIRALATRPDFIADDDNQKFIDAIGRVELWLLDYDVKLAGGDNTHYRLAASPRAAAGTQRVDAVQDALSDLRQRFPKANLPGPSGGFLIFGRSLKFSSQFFALTNSLNNAHEEDAANEAEVEDQILAAASSKADSEDIIGRLNELASRVWDGFKRLWGFLKRLVKAATIAIKDQVWRIARFISARARGAFEFVLKAIEIVHRGSVYLRSRVFPASSPDVAILAFGRDFDVSFFVSQAAAFEDVRFIVDKDAEETHFFVAASRILSALVGIILEVVKIVASNIAGWFLLLLALSRIAGRIKDLVEAVGSIDADSLKTFDTRDAALFSNPVR
ncbi:peptidoglycan-binding domain-containing protein [Viridibacterium curvum]|uniref:Peptidoglycan binding-like domain-containing protein n=1 Tax=Viridibacterium curvum TaxID=1101404 RepID=A0ABP9QMX3_9RHOO